MLSRFRIYNVRYVLVDVGMAADTGNRRCWGAASAKERLDVVIRDAIYANDIPGPRFLGNGKEMARTDGDLVPGITAYANGPDEMREVIRHHVNLGVDQIKISISGEEVSISRTLINISG
jgi:hypothetical protein